MGQRWLGRADLVLALLIDALLVRALFVTSDGLLTLASVAMFVALTSWLAIRCVTHGWVFTILRDHATRISHGLEHATIHIVRENWLTANEGFTHDENKFVIVFVAGGGDHTAAVECAASEAIRRIGAGEHALAYSPYCGTSQFVVAASLWAANAASLVVTWAVGGSAAVCVALGLVSFRIWLACAPSLTLLAQRLVTVSTEFASARVRSAERVTTIGRHTCPATEEWYEVTLELQLAASRGGAVIPGVG